jgi:hypothetical protein
MMSKNRRIKYKKQVMKTDRKRNMRMTRKRNVKRTWDVGEKNKEE